MSFSYSNSLMASKGLGDEYRTAITDPLDCYAHGLDEWGFLIPKHSRDPRSPKDFEWHTKFRQSYHNERWLLGCFMSSTHQLSIRMIQKSKLSFLFWNNCFDMPWRAMAQSHPKCFCESCTNQILENTPWTVLLSESLKNLNRIFSKLQASVD